MPYTDFSLSPKKILQAFPKLPNSTVKFLPYALGLLALLGFLDATYLTILHYKNAVPPCTIHGCEVVLTSQFATIAGIPIAFLGAGYYLLILVFSGLLLQNIKQLSIGYWKLDIGNWILILTGAGLLVGIFLVFIQAFILHAFCQYCLASEVIDFLLFDSAWWLWRKIQS